jgi:hypothetical protein
LADFKSSNFEGLRLKSVATSPKSGATRRNSTATARKIGRDGGVLGGSAQNPNRDDAKINRDDVKPRSLAVVIVDRENLFRNRKL